MGLVPCFGMKPLYNQVTPDISPIPVYFYAIIMLSSLYEVFFSTLKSKSCLRTIFWKSFGMAAIWINLYDLGCISWLNPALQ